MKIPSHLPVANHNEVWSILDSTKLQAFSSCPRSFFYEYILGWRAEQTSNHLIFGQAWHDALEHIYRNGMRPECVADAYNLFLQRYRSQFPESTDSWFKGKTPSNALLGLIEYVKNHASDAYDLEVLDTEVGGQVAIADDRLITVKLDLIARKGSKIMALEHKTGSACGQSWERQWALSIQVGAYLHALNSAYPSYGRATIVVNGTFFYVKERKFLRVPCIRSGEAMLNWLNTVNSLYDRIEYELEVLSGCTADDCILKAFPMNPTACNNYAGCQFHDLCTCVPNPLSRAMSGPPSGFVEFWWNPLAEVKNDLQKGE